MGAMSRSVTQAPPILHLSAVVGRPLRDADGERLGRVEDLIVRLGGAGYPPITGFLVNVAGRTSFLGVDRVSEIGTGGVVMRKAKLDLRHFERRAEEVLLKRDWQRDQRALMHTVVARLGFPVFVKPANLGSSVGISKAKHATELKAAIDLAAQFDRKIIVEAAVPHAREIECAVLGNDEPDASVPGEIISAREFYDYEAKYLDGGSSERIPALITEAQTEEVRTLSVAAFKAIDGAGMARVDFLLAGDSGVLYVNELNTIPGFTTISMYAKLWAASGLDYPTLLDRLIALALERHAEKQQLRTSM